MFVAQNSVRVGEKLSDRIEENLADCDAFLLIWSESAALSPWVGREVAKAHSQGKRIFPLVISGSELLPGFIKNLRYADATSDYATAFVEIRNELDRIEREGNIDNTAWKLFGAAVLSAFAIAAFGGGGESDQVSTT